MIAMLPGYLGRQRWFSGSEPSTVEVVDRDEPTKGLSWLLVDAGSSGRYSVYVAEADADDPPEFLHGHDEALIGAGDDGTLYYDGLLDPDLTKAFLAELLPDGELPSFVRPMGAEQSNTSLVFDDRLVLKAFRRVHAGPNPDIEVTSALAAVGFEAVAAPVATWERDGTHLAVVQPFLGGGTDGWALALTSLRDMFGSGCDDPAQCGGDFGAEARRLGEVTAAMHLALADAFGVVDGTIRVHGDFHLGQVLRTDTGWFVLDFEGEPARSLEERRKPSSPLKDVAGMLRSFHYASAVALRERTDEERVSLAEATPAWEQRNRNAFLDGYLGTHGVPRLLPSSPDDVSAALREWELDKARYELEYERNHRPDWVDIPEAAIARLTNG